MPTDSRWHADHAALETQLLAVLDALIALRPARAAAAFARFAALLDAHLFAEESELLPRLAALPAPRWAPALYLAEHAKLRQLCARYTQTLAGAAARTPATAALRRRQALDLIDALHPLRHVLEHHQQREEQGLLAELEAAGVSPP
ncbi:MAG: hemerythrin domain-containing protein [Lysobacterales bacterium]